MIKEDKLADEHLLKGENLPPAAVPAQSIERLSRAIDLLNRRQTLWFGFWHGLVVGIGSTVGVAIILSLAVWILNWLDFIPGIERIQQLLQTVPTKTNGH